MRLPDPSVLKTVFSGNTGFAYGELADSEVRAKAMKKRSSTWGSLKFQVAEIPDLCRRKTTLSCYSLRNLSIAGLGGKTNHGFIWKTALSCYSLSSGEAIHRGVLDYGPPDSGNLNMRRLMHIVKELAHVSSVASGHTVVC